MTSQLVEQKAALTSSRQLSEKKRESGSPPLTSKNHSIHDTCRSHSYTLLFRGPDLMCLNQPI